MYVGLQPAIPHYVLCDKLHAGGLHALPIQPDCFVRALHKFKIQVQDYARLRNSKLLIKLHFVAEGDQLRVFMHRS